MSIRSVQVSVAELGLVATQTAIVATTAHVPPTSLVFDIALDVAAMEFHLSPRGVNED